MARGSPLNPASVPFIPLGIRWADDESTGGPTFAGHNFREPDNMSSFLPTSSSNVSLSPSELRPPMMSSSPSPPSQSERSVRFQPSPAPREEHSQSPPFRHLDTGKPFPPVIEPRARELSVLGVLDTLPENDDGPGSTPAADPAPSAGLGSPYISPSVQQKERRGTPPVPPHSNGYSRSALSNNAAQGSFTSSSPVSSLSSAGTSQMFLSYEPPIEAQLKASPLIHDILDRLARCEIATREVQRDLGEVHRKVNILVERSLGQPTHGQPPEFKDPFAPSNGNGPGAHSLNGHRGSVIAPNQVVNPSDDLNQISKRLTGLTSSVSQLLALQTQQHIQSATAALSNNLTAAHPHTPDSVAPNQLMPNQLAPSPMHPPQALSHGMLNRPELRPGPRVPNPPMRTWSVGALDLPMRSPDPGLMMNRQEALLRDKRRSVASLTRRNSSGHLGTDAESWQGGPPRESGPMVFKWEQLNLVPELLRSLSKFGSGPPNKIQQRALPFLLRGADIIAQAPPTQERIAAYVIPAIQVALTHASGRPSGRGPIVIMVSTTVDQATQAQRMIRDLGGPIGVRSALGVGTTSANSDLSQELRLLQQSMPHIICGTPQKLHALFSAPGGLLGSEVRFLVLDEVDQLIARNLHEFVFNIVKLLPPPRSRALSNPGPIVSPPHGSPPSNDPILNPTTPFDSLGRRFSTISPSPAPPEALSGLPPLHPPVERQTALFSNTVPQDVLNLATAIQLREPVRVLVRRDGNVTHADTHQGSRGLRQFYLYLAFTAGGRSDSVAVAPGGGLGIIGSGRGSSSAESTQAREWKLDALADLFEDVEVAQCIVHVGGTATLDRVVYKLSSRGLDAVPLHGGMTAGTKLAALNKFRGSSSVIIRHPATKVLVVYDIVVKPPEVSHIPLVINYDLPKAVEEYASRVAPATASNHSRAGVVINFVTATGGDVEMLRSIECFYRIKCPEVPMSLRDIV